MDTLRAAWAFAESLWLMASLLHQADLWQASLAFAGSLALLALGIMDLMVMGQQDVRD